MPKFAFITLLVLLIYGCENEPKPPIQKPVVRDWKQIKADSVLTILAENSPASYFIYRGKNMGYEYELLNEFANDQNLRLQVRMVNNLDEMIHLLNQNEGDIIACNLTVCIIGL